jgi:hypothetical protein
MKSNLRPKKIKFSHVSDEIFLSLKFISLQIIKIHESPENPIDAVLKTRAEFIKVNNLLELCDFFNDEINEYSSNLICQIENNMHQTTVEDRLYIAWKIMTENIRIHIEEKELIEIAKSFSRDVPVILHFMDLYNATVSNDFYH